MLQYARTLCEMMKEMCKRLSDWGVHYFTKSTSWYPLPQGTVKFEDLPHMDPTPPVEMREEDIQRLLDFTCAYGRCVSQLSNRQSYTKAKAGTLPHSCYDNEFVGESAQLDIGNGQLAINSTEEKESKDEMSNEEEEYSDDDSRSSDNEELVHGVTSLSREATFLVGRTTRFGRSVRINASLFD